MKSDLKKYQVDHLFLLVGKNPLPNYVVARSGLLLREGGKPYLVYTQDTQDYAHKLRDKLGITNQELISLDQSQADAFVIQTRIKDKAKALSGRLGLNYTGGTKAMSVNSYIAIKSIKRDEYPVFSYLDPKELKLLIDLPNNRPLSVQINLETTFNELFDLHLIELQHPPTYQPILSELTDILSQYTEKWRNWCDSDLHKLGKERKRSGKVDWKSKGRLKNLLISTQELPSQIIDIFSKMNLLSPQQELSTELMISDGLFGSSSSKSLKACKWLDGIWLEHYLLNKIQQKFPQARLSFDVANIDFEFDVAFIEGYQLFAFSCTTSDEKSICKSKLFEAYIRGKQLGGDEARVALVCCFDDPEILEKEITGIIPDSKIRVFGRRHLRTISDEVAQWVKEQSSND